MIGRKFAVDQNGIVYCSELKAPGWDILNGNIASIEKNIGLFNSNSEDRKIASLKEKNG
jgi:hypothetical protein